jgi:hypothetical protein
VDAERGVARFDGRTLAVPERPNLMLPEAGGPASPDQAGPYVMFGQSWLPFGVAPPAQNAFEATLTGARAVRLDAAAMRLDPRRAITGTVRTEAPLTLELAGDWPAVVVATLDGAPVAVTRSGGVLRIAVPAGEHRLLLAPR